MLRSHVSKILDTRFSQSLNEEQRKDLEIGMYNAALQEAKTHGIRRHWENPEFENVYKIVSRRCISNLEPSSYIGNARLLQRVQNGEFPPHALAFMTARELYPENWQGLADEQLKRETTMLEGDPNAGSDMFKCKRCGQSKTKYWEMQTRSADEPMTIFIRCLNCGKEWRQ
jgi:transcription elongation factor S-II